MATLWVSTSDRRALMEEVKQAAEAELGHVVGFLLAICLQLMGPARRARIVEALEEGME